MADVPMGSTKKIKKDLIPNQEKEKMMYLNLPTAMVLLMKIYKYDDLLEFTQLLIKTFLALPKEELRSIILTTLKVSDLIELKTKPEYTIIERIFGLQIWID